MKLATQVLSCVLKVVTLVGLIILVFGYAYSFLLLDLYGGTLLSSDTGKLETSTNNNYYLRPHSFDH